MSLLNLDPDLVAAKLAAMGPRERDQAMALLQAASPKTLLRIYPPNSDPQRMFVNSEADIAIIGGSAGGGKAGRCPNRADPRYTPDMESKVLTPWGFKLLGDVRPNDQICNPDGTVCRVIDTYDRGIQQFYRVTLDDGSSVEVCGEHLWSVSIAGHRKRRKVLPSVIPDGLTDADQWNLRVMSRCRVVTTIQLLEMVRRADSEVGRAHYPQLPLIAPAAFSGGLTRWECTPPYTLGVIVGDGSICNETVTFSTGDAEVALRIEGEIKDRFRLVRCESKDRCPTYRLNRVKHDDSAQKMLTREGLMGCRSETKFIPDRIKQSPVATRQAFMQGLFDADGYIDDRGHVEFVTVSERLALDTQWMCRSLGLKATISTKRPTYTYKGEKREGQLAYRLYIRGVGQENLFSLQRKRDRAKKFNGGDVWPSHKIVSVVPTVEDNARCIRVDHPNSLYITDDFITTHNTIGELLEPSKDCDCPEFNAVVFRRTMKQVKDEGGIWDQSMDLYTRAGAKPNLTERYWTFPSGASIQFAGLENDADKYTWKGAQICDILFDELTEFLESQFWYLMSRNRSTCGRKVRVRGSTNPAPGWVKRLLAPWVDRSFPSPAQSGELRWFVRENDQIVWLDSKPQREVCMLGPNGEGCYRDGCDNCFPPEKSITFIRATVYDNRDLLKANPGYIGSLKAQDDVEMRRLLLGDWEAKPAHLMIDAFDETRNVVSWRKLDPNDYRFYIGGDFGGHNTAEICIAEEIHSGHLIWIAEDWPGHSRGWDQISGDTKALLPAGAHITDGAGGNRTGEQGWREAFRSRGIPMAEPDPLFCDPKLQYQVMNNLFRSGRLSIFEGCVKTIAMLGAFLRKIDPKTGSVTDEFDDSPFHLLAAGRYILVKLRPPEFLRESQASHIPHEESSDELYGNEETKNWGNPLQRSR